MYRFLKFEIFLTFFHFFKIQIYFNLKVFKKELNKLFPYNLYPYPSYLYAHIIQMSVILRNNDSESQSQGF